MGSAVYSSTRGFEQLDSGSGRRLVVGDAEYGVGEPALEFWVVAELFEELSVVFHHAHDDAPERLIVLDPGVLFVRVLLGVLVGDVRRDLLRDFLGDELPDSVGVFPRYVAELVVEYLEDVREPIKLRLPLSSAASDRHRADLGAGIGQLD